MLRLHERPSLFEEAANHYAIAVINATQERHPVAPVDAESGEILRVMLIGKEERSGEENNKEKKEEKETFEPALTFASLTHRLLHSSL